MTTLTIATACFINDQNQLLVVRKQNTHAWMLPGGKLDAGETAAQALVRELFEELQITLNEADLQVIGRFEAVAANESNTFVSAQAFLAKLPCEQTPMHAAEIAEIMWLSLNEPLPESIAPLLKDSIIPALKARQPN